MKKVFNIFILFTIFCFCFCCQNIVVAENSNIIKEPANNQIEYINKQYEYLLKDVEDFRDYIQKERTEHRTFLEELYTKTCWGIGILITLFVGICSFLGWKSYDNIKKQTETYITDKAKDIINNANKEVNNQIEILKDRVDEELSYKNAKMFIYGVNNELEDITTIFHKKGIGKIVNSKDLTELDKSFCFAIFSINSEDEFKNIIYYLEKEKLNIPFLIYTSLRINPDLFKSCPYYCSIANSKTTLIINTFSLLKMFC